MLHTALRLGGICVWDLVYKPDSDCRLLALIGPDRGLWPCVINTSTTADGMDLVIGAMQVWNIIRLVCSPMLLTNFCRQEGFVLIYEICAQNESPQLTEIANYNFVAPLGNPMTTTTPMSLSFSAVHSNFLNTSSCIYLVDCKQSQPQQQSFSLM